MTLSFSNLAQDLKDYADDTRYVLGFLSIVSIIL